MEVSQTCIQDEGGSSCSRRVKPIARVFHFRFCGFSGSANGSTAWGFVHVPAGMAILQS